MKFASFLFALLFSTQLLTQDTIVVQAFNFESTTRDSSVIFPDLDHNEYEKILMQYTMRCKDGLVSTAADRNRGCGEWDYSCNTSVFDSSIVDSLKAIHPSYIITGFDGMIFDYTTQPVYSYYQYEHQVVTVNSANGENIIAATEPSNLAQNFPANGDLQNSKSYFLYTAQELADVAVGSIDGISFNVADLGVSEIDFLRIKMATADVTELEAELIADTDFTEVYFQNTGLSSGENKLVFHTAFDYAQDQNLLFEFSYSNATAGTPNVIDGFQGTSTQAAYTTQADSYLDFNESFHVELPTDKIAEISEEITIAFWAKGNEAVMPKSTTIFEGVDDDNLRQLNLHLPWGDSKVYFDCGNDGGGYDRISKNASADEIGGQWNHWAFTKNAVSGNMRIFLNGALWHNGSGMNKKIDVTKFFLGASTGLNRYYNGGVDDFSIWKNELTGPQIKELMYKQLDSDFEEYADLVAYYDFNEGSGAVLQSNDPSGQQANIVDPPIWRSFKGHDMFKNLNFTTDKPSLSILQGTYNLDVTNLIVLDSVQNNPTKAVPYTIDGTDLVEGATEYYWEANETYVYDEEGNVVSTIPVMVEGQLFVFDMQYFRKLPAKFELLSFVTPYGIGLDFGDEGKSWTFDVTDYGPILKNSKRLLMDKGGQWQEDIDIKFIFIKGTPSRNVLSVQQVWPVISSSYNNIANNNNFEMRTIAVEPEVEQMKVRAVVTGHGQEGEFIARDHWLDVNGGSNEMQWRVWQECSDNAVYPQGGTWIYDRAGWCPGQPSLEREWEIMGLVNDDESFTLDYGIITAQGDSRYIVNTQLVKYSGPNFSNDAMIEDIITPSKKDEYFRLNPICGKPKIVIKNNGANDLTSLTIRYGVEGTSLSSFNWTGSLGYLKSEEVELPVLKDGKWAQNNVFVAFAENPNGQVDEYAANDRMESEFETVPYLTDALVVQLKTNFLPNESRWYLYDAQGNVIESRTGGLSANTTYTDTIYGLNGCFHLQFVDTDQDGISWWANNDGDGAVRVRDINSVWTTLEPDFGQEISYRFTMGELTSTEETISERKIEVYPNPVIDLLAVELYGMSGTVTLRLVDQLGRVVQTFDQSIINQVYDEVRIDMSTMESGVYFLSVEDGVNPPVVKHVFK